VNSYNFEKNCFEDRLLEVKKFIKKNEINNLEGGLYDFDGQPMLIAVKPILKSDKSGEPQGNLIFGRYISTSFLADLAKKMDLPLKIISDDTDDEIKFINDLEMVGYKSMCSPDSKPLFTIELVQPRDILSRVKSV
jgi:hypothetical protein